MSPKSTKNSAPLSREFLKGLWSKINSDNWFGVVNEFKPDGQWKKNGDQIRGLCLEHQETTPSMDIVINKGFVYCHGCGYREFNPLDFYRKLSGYSTLNVIGDLSQRFGIKFPGKAAEKLQAAKEHNDMKIAFFRACTEEFRNQLITLEPYAEAAINWLHTRNLDFSTSQLWPIGIVPPPGKLRAYLEQNRIPQFYQTILTHAYPANASHAVGHVIMFPFSSPSTISYLKTRAPFSKDFRLISDQTNDCYSGVFCLNTFSYLLGNIHDRPVYVVEGEYDALSIFSHSRAAGQDDLCIISTGGNHETDLRFLADFGINNLCLIPDNDMGGIAWAQHILKSSGDLVKQVVIWPSNTPARTDPEEFIGKVGFKDFWDVVQNNLGSKADWAYDVVAPRLIDVDSLKQIEQVVEISKCLFDVDRVAFHQKVQKEFGIQADLIPTSIIDELDDESIGAFIIKLTRDITQRYTPLFSEDVGGTRQYIMYNNEKKNLATFPISRSSDRCRLELQSNLGLSAKEYFGKLGEPEEVAYKFDKNGMKLDKPTELVAKTRNFCVQQAVELSNIRTAPRSGIKELNRGVHFIDNMVFVSNGNVLIKGEIIDDDISFTEMNSPLVNQRGQRLLFTPNLQRWSEHINAPTDLYAGQDFDLKETFETIVDLLNNWQLDEKENGISQKILAADVLYTPIASVFPVMTTMRMKGPSSSGKSALMSFLYRPRDPTGYFLCEAAVYLDSYSWAGIRGLLNGSTLRLCLDEFEQSSRGNLTKYAEATNMILHHIRNISEGSETAMGRADMTAAEFSMKCPVFVSGIHSMFDYRDASRFVPIGTTHIDGFRSPVSKIKTTVTKEQIQELQRRITLGMFHRIPEIRKTADEIERELSKFGCEHRLTRLLIPAGCIMKMVGIKDHLTILEKFISLKDEQIKNTVDDDAAGPIIKTVFRTPFRAAMVSSNCATERVKLEDLLQDPTAYNLPLIGVHILDENHVVIRWIEFVNTVFEREGNARGKVGRYRSTIANSKYDVSRKRLSPVLRTKLDKLMGNSVSEYDYSIINMRVAGVTVSNLHSSLTAPVETLSPTASLNQFADI